MLVLVVGCVVCCCCVVVSGDVVYDCALVWLSLELLGVVACWRVL